MAEYGGGSALRVLALAYRPWPSDRLDVHAADEAGLVLIGLVGMQVRCLALGQAAAWPPDRPLIFAPRWQPAPAS